MFIEKVRVEDIKIDFDGKDYIVLVIYYDLL